MGPLVGKLGETDFPPMNCVKPTWGLHTTSLVMLNQVILVYLCRQIVKMNLDLQIEFRQKPGSER